MKKYVTDGLLQIALLLSILRTDLNLNNYLNLVDNHFTYPEIHDIILGSSSAYTQTSNFHNNHWHDGLSGYSHPKNIDNFYASSVFRELHSLSHYRRFANIRTNLDSYLVTGDGQLAPISGGNANDNSNGVVSTGGGSGSSGGGVLVPPPPGNGDDNANLQQQHPSSPEGAAEPAETESQPFNFLQQFPGGELSKEDMDLIEILWRQDMDLGVGREAYDLNKRRQLEKDRELELHKQQELEESGEPENDQTVLLPPEDEDLSNYVVDTETGEWVLAAQNENGESTPVQLDDNDGLSAEEAILFLQTQLHQPAVGENMDPGAVVPPAVVVPLDTEHVVAIPQGTASVGDGLLAPLPLVGPEEAELEAMFSVAEQMTADLQQQFDEVPNSFPVESITPVPRQPDYEQSWQELLLEMPAANVSGDPLPPQYTVPPAVDINPADLSLLNISDADTGPLIHNITMVPPSDQSFNFSQTLDNTTEPQFPMQTNATMLNTPPMEPLGFLNGSMPNQSNDTGFFGFNNTEFLLPNLTTPIKQEDDDAAAYNAGGATGSELGQLLDAQDPMDTLDFTVNETTIAEGLHHARMMRDDVSSDSALSSMGSSPQHNDFNETASMQSNISYDGLGEGATGGSDYGSVGDRHSPRDMSAGYTESTRFRFGAGGGRSNTQGRRHRSSDSGSSSFGGGWEEPKGYGAPGAMKNVLHNHTYIAPPGEAPKERKSDIKKKQKLSAARNKDLSKDERKAQDMRIPFTAEEIINSPVEEFNDMIERHKLTEPQKQLIRDIRRRGKNKVAAQNCRKRKIDTIGTLEDEVIDLRRQLDRMRNDVGKNTKERDLWRAKLDSLMKDTFNIKKDNNGDPFDPTQVTLDQTTDGSWVFVPKNETDNEHTNRSSRKRKGGPDKKHK